MSMPPMAPTDDATEESLRFERACEWFIQLREGLQSPEAVSSWLEWCSVDPRNREAFERARQVWAVTEGATEENLGLSGAASRETRPARWSRADNLSRRKRWIAAGAALAATFTAVAFIVPSMLRQAAQQEAASVHETPVGVNREVALGDGSKVFLGGGTRLVASIKADERRLTLQSGEAYFKVARDKQRPFVVSVGAVRVTALGTEFNVRTGEDRVVVAVAQGLVQIDSTKKSTDGIAPRAPVRAGAGETVSLDTLDESMQLAHADPVNMASWKQGRLEFTREPLEAVIESVNRYSGRRIALDGAELGDLRFTGTVFTDRLDDWIRGLPEIFPVAVREDERSVAIVAEPH